MYCKNCGAELEQKTDRLMVCPNCNTEYLMRKDKNENIQIRLSYRKIEKLICIGLVLMIILFFGGKYLWKNYIRTPEKERFSKAYQEFLTTAFDKDVHEISEEELASIKYLKIDDNKVRYTFQYSFESKDNMLSEDSFSESVESVSVDYMTNQIVMSDVTNLTGLTHLTIEQGQDIRDFSFLENMENLKELDIQGIDEKTRKELESQYGDIMRENESYGE